MAQAWPVAGPREAPQLGPGLGVAGRLCGGRSRAAGHTWFTLRPGKYVFHPRLAHEGRPPHRALEGLEFRGCELCLWRGGL